MKEQPRPAWIPDKWGSDPNRFYKCERVTLAAGAETVVTYDAIPDQIVVRPLVSAPIIDNVEIRPIGALGSGAEQLRGTGPIVIPGLSKSVSLKNNDLVSRTLIVTAQKGYLPLSIVMPTTAAEPLTVDVQSSSLQTAIASPVTFAYIHSGNGPVLVLITMHDWTAVQSNPASVVVGGEGAVLLRGIGATAAGNRAINVSAWGTGNQEPGTKTITITAAAGYIGYRVFVMSFDYGTVFGGVASDSSTASPATLAPAPIGTTNQNKVFAVCGQTSAVVGRTMVEGTAAVPLASEVFTIVGPYYCAMQVHYHENQAGAVAFSYACAGATEAVAAVGVEVYIP